MTAVVAPRLARRVIGPTRVERNVRALRASASAAARAGRPEQVLAVQLYALDTIAPRGMSPNTARVAAVMVAASEHRSGRRARPGRQVCADILKLCERTVERQWRILEAVDAGVVLVQLGRWLTADDRAQAVDDVDADAATRHRWRDRSEWHLTIPAWAHTLTADDLAPYLDRARALLDAVACGNVDNPRVLHVAGRALHFGRVAPSRRGLVFERGIYLRGASSTGRQRQKGGPTGHSPRNRGQNRRPGSVRPPTSAAILARELARDRRFPWLARENPYKLTNTLTRRLGSDTVWTPDDVDLAGHLRIRNSTYTVPAVIAAPAGYLDWMLGEADPACPPATEHRAAVAAESTSAVERTRAGRAADAERREQADAARAGGAAAARAALAAATGLARDGKR